MFVHICKFELHYGFLKAFFDKIFKHILQSFDVIIFKSTTPSANVQRSLIDIH